MTREARAEKERARRGAARSAGTAATAETGAWRAAAIVRRAVLGLGEGRAGLGEGRAGPFHRATPGHLATTATARGGAAARAGGLLAGALLVALARPAVADEVRKPDEAGLPGGEGGTDKPWQRGVSERARQAAEREFLAGNELFERAEYAAAAARYREALAAWAHPGIQFNLAVCLIHLDRPIEAYDMVQATLRYGREALPGHFDEATNYERLLRDRIATLEVVVPEPQPGTVVTLDGEPLLPAPAAAARSSSPPPSPRAPSGAARVVRRLAPGRHALVARRPQYETWSKDLVLAPGEVTREVIVLRAPRTRTVRRWSAAMPWWVVGAGGAAVAAGTAGLLLGNANLRAVTAEVTQQCPPPMGCRDGLPSGLAADRDRAELEQRAGVTLLAAGAAAVATGVVLLVLNQPRQVLDSSAVTPGVAIHVTPERLGLGWAHAF